MGAVEDCPFANGTHRLLLWPSPSAESAAACESWDIPEKVWCVGHKSRSQSSWPRMVRKLIVIKAARAHFMYESIELLPKNIMGASANQLRGEIEKGEEEGLPDYERRLMAMCSQVGLADQAEAAVKKIKALLPRVVALARLLRSSLTERQRRRR